MRLMPNVPRVLAVVGAILVGAALLAPVATGAPATPTKPAKPGTRTPVVLFPAFHFTKLVVTVHNQTAAPACPRSGSFEDWFLNDTTSPFSQVCQDRLPTLRYQAR